MNKEFKPLTLRQIGIPPTPWKCKDFLLIDKNNEFVYVYTDRCAGVVANFISAEPKLYEAAVLAFNYLQNMELKNSKHIKVLHELKNAITKASSVVKLNL